MKSKQEKEPVRLIHEMRDGSIRDSVEGYPIKFHDLHPTLQRLMKESMARAME